MLQQDMEVEAEGSSCSTSGASKTLAAARTSTSHLIQVSLRLTEPPGLSCVCLQIPDGLDAKYSRVVAAHGDSMLIEVPHGHTTDHFVTPAATVDVFAPAFPSRGGSARDGVGGTGHAGADEGGRPLPVAFW